MTWYEDAGYGDGRIHGDETPEDTTTLADLDPADLRPWPRPEKEQT